MATHPTGRGADGNAFSPGTVPAALGRNTVAISYFWGPLGPPPLSTPLGKDRTVLICEVVLTKGNGDNLIASALPLWARPPARSAFFPASTVPVARCHCWPRRGVSGLSTDTDVTLTACRRAGLPCSAGTGGYCPCVAPGGLIPNVPVDLELGSPIQGLSGARTHELAGCNLPWCRETRVVGTQVVGPRVNGCVCAIAKGEGLP